MSGPSFYLSSTPAPAPDGDVRVMGLDLSLTSTGIVIIGDDLVDHWRITPPALPVRTGSYDLKRLKRVRYIVSEIEMALTMRPGIGLVVIEGLFQGGGKSQGGLLERAWLAGRVRDVMYDRDMPVAHMEPTQVKTYATGRGNATKDEVLAAVVRRYRDVTIDTNDEADAFVLAAAGRDHLGKPPVPVPATHRKALDRTIWPTLDTTQ